MKVDRVLVTGALGQLGREFCKEFGKENINFLGLDKGGLDITNTAEVENVISEAKPEIVINCAAYNKVDEAEENKDLALNVNGDGVDNLARACVERDIFLVHFGSDYIFSGFASEPYCEEHLPNPLNVYGESKLLGENLLRKRTGNYLLFRLSWLFGPGGNNFLSRLDQWIKGKSEIGLTTDEISIPCYTADVVKVVILALREGLKGVYHLVGDLCCSRYAFGSYYLAYRQAGVKVKKAKRKDFNLPASRPEFSAMSNRKIKNALGITIPDWRSAVRGYAERDI